MESARVIKSVVVRFLVSNIDSEPKQTFPSHALEHAYDIVLTDMKPHVRERIRINPAKQVDTVFLT